MSEHRIKLHWKRTSRSFHYDDYNREHEWLTGSGKRICATAAPAFLGNGDCVDPEEAFVAAVSSCHMLTFLALCARGTFVVDAYDDEAVGLLAPNDHGRLAVTQIELHPTIRFAGTSPTEDVLRKLHEQSHRDCFIANSVTTAIRVCSK